MNEEEMEEMLGHYLDNLESAATVCMGHIDSQDLSDEEIEEVRKFLKQRIEEAL